MKLYYSNTSPYSRKVRMVMIEKNLHSSIEGVLVNPFADNPELANINPLGKIPALMLEDGEVLFDSPVICRYLDGLADGTQLIPLSGEPQWTVLRWEALADGMTDAAYNLVMERRRPTSEQSSGWMARWSNDIQRALEEMERRVDELAGELTLAQLAAATAVGYLDFRLPELLYEAECPQVAANPKLQSWYERFKTRPAMQATQPRDN